MSIVKYINRIRHIDSLLRTKTACSSDALAKRIKLSRSAVMEYLSDMKELGFPITYSKKDKCYYYEIEGRMTKSLFEKEKIK